MEINDFIIKGDYENCYQNLFQNVKNESDQRQLLDFMEMTKMKCLEIYEKRFREYEQQITQKCNNEYIKEVASLTDEAQKNLLQVRKINQMYSEMNQQLSEKLQASLIFGSIIYSVGDFRLKQEKIKQQNLQNKNDCYKTKIQRFKKEAVCFVNMNRTKDDFILQLKNKINSLQLQLKITNSPQDYTPPEFLSTSDSKDNTLKDAHTNSEQSSNGSLKRFEIENSLHNQDSRQSNPEDMNQKIIEEKPKIEQTDQIFSDFDMYNYSFGKLFKSKSLQLIEDNQNQNVIMIKQELQEQSQQATKIPNEQQKVQSQHLVIQTNLSQTISNAQVLKTSINFPPILNDKQPRISLFNSNSDQSLKRKSNSPSPSNNTKKLRDIGSNNNSPSLGRMKKTNSQSLSCNYGQNIYTKTDPDVVNQMMIEPQVHISKVQSNQQVCSNSSNYSINNNSNNNQKYNIQVSSQINYYEGQSPRSFIIHKLGSNLKTQIPHNSINLKKKL